MEEKSEVETEVEALKAIFWDDFVEVSENPKKIKVLVKPSEHVELPESMAQNQTHLLLNVEYPLDGYPEVVPKIKVEKQVISSVLRIEDLQINLERVGEESRGMAMVFSLVQFCKDWLDEQVEKVSKSEEER